MSRTARIASAQKRAFIETMAKYGTVHEASRQTGIARSTHYRWLGADPAYAEAFRAAEDAAIEAMEAEARRRAVEGTTKPVYQGGEHVGDVQEYSDQLLMFLLKGKRPEVYRERVDLTVTDVRKMAEQRAVAEGLDPEEVWAELESILPGAR